MKKLLAVVASLGLLAAGGCATTSGSVSSDENGSNTVPSSSAPPSTGSRAERPSDDGTVKFGQAYKWDDGLLVKISKPKPFHPSSSALVEGKGTPVVFHVKIVNKTGKTYDPNLFSTTAQSGPREAKEIYDSAKGLDGSPTTKILDGRESKFRIGYNVANPKDIVMDVSVDFLTHDPVTYTTK